MELKQLFSLVSTILVILGMAVSGCITINMQAPTPTTTALPTPTFTPTPTPTPSQTPEPTVTPTPTPTPTPVDNIVGIWVGYIEPRMYALEFLPNGTVDYYIDNSFKGTWTWNKIDDRHYMVGVGKGNSSPVITINEEMTAFNGLDGLNYFVKTSSPPPLYRYSTGVIT